MRRRKTIGILIATALSASLHLAALNAFSKSPPPVLIKGGSIQVEIGLNSASSPASAAGAQEALPEREETSDKPNTESVEPDSAPSPELEPETQTEPKTETELSPSAEDIVPEISDEISDIPSPEKAADPEQQPEPVKPPEQASPAPDQTEPPTKSEDRSAEEAKDQQTPPATTEGGEPSTPSVGSSSEEAAPEEHPAAKVGNAESENYAGLVMEHLSRVRRPRASVPGSARVAFKIAPSGELESVTIVKSSGSTKFDRDAIRMVERAAPFPKPPPGVNTEFVVEIEGG